MREFVITPNEANQRMDKYLGKLLKEAPKSFFYKMLRKKNIVLNDKKATGNEKLKTGDSIKLYLSNETFDKFAGARENVPALNQKKRNQWTLEESVVYEDENVLFLNKPVGILSQKATPEDVSVNEYVIRYLLDTHAIEEKELQTFKPSICNRLDRNTSGLITAGKSLQGLQELSVWFRDRSVGKYYLCLVKGVLEHSEKISGYLKKNEKTNQVLISKKEEPGTQRIETAYRPVCVKNGYTLLEVKLITGKTHQIRAHLASIGHPIAGDFKYGNRSWNQKLKEGYGLQSQLLHSWRLEVPESLSLDSPLSALGGRAFTADPPELFCRICKDLGVM